MALGRYEEKKLGVCLNAAVVEKLRFRERDIKQTQATRLFQGFAERSRLSNFEGSRARHPIHGGDCVQCNSLIIVRFLHL